MVFRRQHSVPADKQITLMFDGEALEVQQQVRETEIIDCAGDGSLVLDVHVR